MIIRKAIIIDGKETELTLSKMAQNANEAARRVAANINAGKPVFASQEVIEERLAICKACEFWADEARFGLGKCKHSQCGCTRLKQRLASESCPDGRWSKVDN